LEWSLIDQSLDQWFPKWAVRNSSGAVKQKWANGDGEADMDGWEAIGDPVNN